MAEVQERHVPSHLRRELQGLDRRISDGDPLWPAQLAVAVAIGLHLGLSDKLVIGPRWLIPAVEGVLLITLIVIAPPRADHLAGRYQRPLLFTILALVTLTYLVSLVLLVHYLVTGGHTQGRALIGSGAVLWVTNVVLFSVIYFELDGGGPLARFRKDPWRDFQFPQMENPELTPMQAEVAPDVLRLLLHLADQRHRLQPHRHHADHPGGEAVDGDTGHGRDRDHRARPRPRGQHPRLRSSARTRVTAIKEKQQPTSGPGRPPRLTTNSTRLCVKLRTCVYT